MTNHAETAAPAEQPVRRNTWQKEAVREALAASGRFISAQALHATLSERGTKIGLATVYRALSALAETGEADSLQSGGGEALYRLCGTEAHHHHLICRSCGRAEEIRDEPVERWAAEVAAAHGYADPRHLLDVFGLCPDCAAG